MTNTFTRNTALALIGGLSSLHASAADLNARDFSAHLQAPTWACFICRQAALTTSTARRTAPARPT